MLRIHTCAGRPASSNRCSGKSTRPMHQTLRSLQLCGCVVGCGRIHNSQGTPVLVHRSPGRSPSYSSAPPNTSFTLQVLVKPHRHVLLCNPFIFGAFAPASPRCVPFRPRRCYSSKRTASMAGHGEQAEMSSMRRTASMTGTWSTRRRDVVVTQQAVAPVYNGVLQGRQELYSVSHGAVRFDCTTRTRLGASGIQQFNDSIK